VRLRPAIHVHGPRRRVTVALGSTTLLLLAVQAGTLILHSGLPAEAQATNVVCGEVITTNRTLNGDLMNCSNHGLVIGAPGITLNLGGHTIDGIDGANQFGILNSGHDNVTITNGSVTDFLHGVVLRSDTRANRVQTLRLSSNSRGVVMEAGKANVITGNNVFANTLDGIVVLDTSTITNNTVTGNTNVGIGLLGGAGSVVSGNKTVSNDNIGIFANASASATKFTNNVANSNSYGILSDDTRATFTGNTANFNVNAGITGAPGITDGGGNKARDNGDPRQCRMVACL
jgi:parallel beta-helix repeat protein